MVINDDQERGVREEDAIQRTGAWLHRFADQLVEQRQAVSQCLERLGWSSQALQRPLRDVPLPADARWEKLWEWIQEKLMEDDDGRGGAGPRPGTERLIIFTEYKHSLDYLMERLRRVHLESPQVESLFGGASSEQREKIKTAFNDPRHPLRILVGTDTVSEGISLQMTCRYVIHQEIPWNPMRLEQRNGRVDRHGQVRDVYAYHFTSNDEADLQFMAAVVTKVNQARNDLGSVGQVIDSSVTENFTRQSLSLAELDERVQEARDDPQEEIDLRTRDTGDMAACWRARQRLSATEMDLGLSSKHAAQLLMQAVEYEEGRVEPVENGRAYRFTKIPATWKKLVKETIERPNGIPKLVFDPAYFVDGRFFKPRPDAELLRLSHPLMQRAIGVLRRQMWNSECLTRWTLYGCSLPSAGRDIMLLHLLLEVTNKFHETAHQEVILLPFELHGPKLQKLEDEYWGQIQYLPRHGLSRPELEHWVPSVREYWSDHRRLIRSLIEKMREEKIQEFERIMQERGRQEVEEETKIFANRLKELEKQKQPPHLRRLQREIEQLEKKLRQRTLFAEYRQEELLQEQHLLELQWEKDATDHLERMKTHVTQEQERVLKQVLPKRYALANVDIQPLAIEYLVHAAGKERG